MESCCKVGVAAKEPRVPLFYALRLFCGTCTVLSPVTSVLTASQSSSQNRLWHLQVSLTHRRHLYLLPGSSLSASSPTSKGVHEPLPTLSTLSETRAPHSIHPGAGWVFHFLLGHRDTATLEDRGWCGWWGKESCIFQENTLCHRQLQPAHQPPSELPVLSPCTQGGKKQL